MSISNDSRQLRDLEERILSLLQASRGNVLDDEALIDTLETSKVTALALAGRVAEAQDTERRIDASRDQYRPVAVRGALLFFVVADLAKIDPMYQHSLAYFSQLYLHCIQARAGQACATCNFVHGVGLLPYMRRMVSAGDLPNTADGGGVRGFGDEARGAHDAPDVFLVPHHLAGTLRPPQAPLLPHDSHGDTGEPAQRWPRGAATAPLASRLTASMHGGDVRHALQASA